MKVLKLTAWYPTPESPCSGIFVKDHARMVAQRHDVVVLCMPQMSRDGRFALSDEVEDGIRTVRPRIPHSRLPRGESCHRYSSLFRAFHHIVKSGFRPDIIHAHVIIAGIPAVFFGRLYRIPVVMTEHWSAFPQRLLSPAFIRMARYAMKRMRVVIAVSHALREHILAHGIQARFVVLPNPIDTTLFRPSRQDIRIRRSAGLTRMLAVSLLAPVKGLSYLLDALAAVAKDRSDFVLDIVGDGPHRGELEAQVKQLGLSRRVRFHGLKTKPEVAKFMKNCDFLVQPSVWDNCPLSVIEASVAGCPILATDVGGIPEIVCEGGGVLAPPRNADALAQSVRHMLDHYAEFSRERIAELAQQRFSFEAVGNAVDDLYAEIVPHPRSAANGGEGDA